jgi:O-acetyl-ADP-ribose deacetylase (regulator of RNase III)
METGGMVKITRGDILSAHAEALVNTVNCVGVMGRGVALQFKRAFPDNFKEYEKACERGEIRPGSMFVVENTELTGPRFIINFPTKRDWKNKSRIEDIESGLAALVDVIRSRGIRSIALPPLGCGLGGLDWEDVRPRIERALAVLSDVEAILFEPAGAPASASEGEAKAPTMTPGRAALLGLMRRYLAGLMDPFVSLLEIHKLMYFMQEAGEPLKLEYAKAPYGPYAENLRHVLRRIDGYFVTGYADGGDKPDKTIEAVPDALVAAEAFLTDRPEIRARFDRVADLVEGFESPFGLELLSSVHWVATREGATNPAEAARLVHAWNERKKRFLPEQIAIAWDILATKGWIRGRAA